MCVFQWKTGHISQKRWEIQPRLLLITNMKWHTLCHIRWKSLTLDDLEGHWHFVPAGSAGLSLPPRLCTWLPGLRSSAHVTPQRTSTIALFDYSSAGRSTHYAFYHWRPHLSSDCYISLEQFAGVGPVVSVVASFPQQTENRTFCLVLQSWLTASHCTDYYYVSSLFRLIVTCPCSLRT